MIAKTHEASRLRKKGMASRLGRGFLDDFLFSFTALVFCSLDVNSAPSKAGVDEDTLFAWLFLFFLFFCLMFQEAQLDSSMTRSNAILLLSHTRRKHSIVSWATFTVLLGTC